MGESEDKEARNAYLNRELYRLDDRVVLITGTSAGIGKETMRDLALRGATVIMGNRDLEKTERVLTQLRQQEPEGALPDNRMIVRRLDLADLSSVRSFAEGVKKDFPVIDILINNAGKMGGHREVTTDGFESQLQTNHLGHFLLTYLLMDNILASKNKPRIINVSSEGHRLYNIDLNDLQCEKSYPLRGFGAYSRTKLMNILFTKSLAQKYQGRVNTYSLHPGVVKTELVRYSAMARMLGYLGVGLFAKNEREGALTTIYCAVSKQAGSQSGLYYSDSNVYQPTRAAFDKDLAQKLWDKSCELLAISWDVETVE